MAWNLEEAISHYKSLGAPRDQTALISLLREVQRENNGSIPGFTLEWIAQAYDLKVSFLLAIIRRIPSLHLDDCHCLELCAGPNCGKQAALVQYAEKLHTASGTKFIFRSVPCMRMCGKGPNIKWDGKLYHRADKILLQELLTNAGIEF